MVYPFDPHSWGCNTRQWCGVAMCPPGVLLPAQLSGFHHESLKPESVQVL